MQVLLGPQRNCVRAWQKLLLGSIVDAASLLILNDWYSSKNPA